LEKTEGLDEAMITRYERLRRHGLSESVDGAALGWALFVRRGMACWMRAWSKTVPSGELPEGNPVQNRGADVRKFSGILPPESAEITMVLAGMALCHLRTDSAILSGGSG